MRESAYSRRIASPWRTLLALAALGGAILALSSDPAEAQTTFTVNKTGDAGDRKLNDSKCDSKRKNGKQCTLRAAIEESNDTVGADTIEFDIGDTNSVKTISPGTVLPTITEQLTIDGYTQRGARENALEQGTDAVLKVELNGANTDGASGLRIEAAESTVRGLVINRFDVSGISVGGGPGNIVEGNFIGTNTQGTDDLGNGSGGVSISGDSPDNTIGGTQPEQRNLISGNDNAGVGIAGASSGNIIQGNLIGATVDGTGGLGNTQVGVRIFGSDNTVGGTVEGARNVISSNDGYGVEINGSGATGNSVLSNSIFQNAGLGIDLSGGTEDPNSVTANDTDDPDTGSNNLQNFPVITSAIKDSTTGETTISGTLNSNPSQDFVIQCFLTGGADTSDHGEGSILLDTVSAATNANGDGNFSCESSLLILGQIPGQTVSATVTNRATGDTSEFSMNRTVITVP